MRQGRRKMQNSNAAKLLMPHVIICLNLIFVVSLVVLCLSKIIVYIFFAFSAPRAHIRSYFHSSYFPNIYFFTRFILPNGSTQSIAFFHRTVSCCSEKKNVDLIFFKHWLPIPSEKSNVLAAPDNQSIMKNSSNL